MQGSWPPENTPQDLHAPKNDLDHQSQQNPDAIGKQERHYRQRQAGQQKPYPRDDDQGGQRITARFARMATGVTNPK